MPQFEFTTAAAVKARAGISGSSKDTLIGSLIVEVSQMFEEVMGRDALIVNGRIEVYRLRRFSRVVLLKGSPVTAVTEVKLHTTRDFSTVTALDALSYETDLEAGILELKFTQPYRPAYLQVTYDGGMATDTADMLLQYPRLAAACDRECVERLRRAEHPTGDPQIRGGGRGASETSAQSRANWDTLEQTRDVLISYGRNLL